MAVATKFGALPILTLLAVAVAFRWRAERKAHPLLYGIATGVAMILWSMAPAPEVAAVWRTVGCLARAFRNVSAAKPAPLSWVLPFFAVTVSFDVKFLPYLLPIYPC